MATSHYFNNYSGVATNEQRLLEDVVTESIKIMGHDCWYVPREGFDERDFLFGENAHSKFKRAYLLEFYLANVEGYEGDGDFFSKFGLDIRDTSNFICSRRSFEKYVPSSLCTRPREGDLIYVPVLNKLFEVKFVEEELLFMSLGKTNPYIYELRCEMFRSSQENIETGVEEVDDVGQHYAYTVEMDVSVGSGNYQRGEIIYQGANLASATATAKVNNWDPFTKKLYIFDTRGSFTSNVTISGETSGASYIISSSDTLGDNQEYDLYDNKNLQDEASTFIDFSETNPFGVP